MSDIFIGQDIDAIFNEAKKRGAQGAEDLQAILNELRPDAETERTLAIARQLREAGEDTVSGLIKEHDEKLNRGGLRTGYSRIDETLFFSPAELNVIQAFSGHGKTTFMLNLLYRFLTKQENVKAVFITYEQARLRVRERFLNIIARHRGDRTIIRKAANKYEYETNTDHYLAVAKEYDDLVKSGNLRILYNVNYDDLDLIIRHQKEDGKTLVLFLDYIQILPASFKTEGWERIKDIAYGLERLAVRNEIILFTGSQSNEQGDTREGKDIYNAATTVIKLDNLSYTKQKGKKEKEKFVERIGGKDVITVSIDKAKNFKPDIFEQYLLFDGYVYDENTEGIQEHPCSTTS